MIDRDVTERFRAASNLAPLGSERIPLRCALGRVLSENVIASVNVPAFDRSNFDGFAVHAADSNGASELVLRSLQLRRETLDAGTPPAMNRTRR